MKTVKKGDKGYATSDIQRRLKKMGFTNLDTDGIFGSLTSQAVSQFQQDRGLLANGIVDEETWQELVEASYSVGERTLYLKSPMIQGDDVRTLQIWLRTLGFDPGPVDGDFGEETEEALKEFQYNMGLKIDGIASAGTIKSFLNLRSILEQNEESELPKKELIDNSSLADISKLKILIDSGHGGSDKGAIGPTDLNESIICQKISVKVTDLLEMLGAEVYHTKESGLSKNVSDRINLSNKLGFPFLLSVHLNHSANKKAEGSSCYYFEKGKISSKEGKKLASLIQKELVQVLGTKDCRVHGKNFNILRKTKATAVIVEPCFITNPAEEKLLSSDNYLQKIAYAIFDGIKNYLEST